MNIDNRLRQKRELINWLKDEKNFNDKNYDTKLMVYQKFQKKLKQDIALYEFSTQLDEHQKEQIHEFFPDALTVEKWFRNGMITLNEYNWYMDILESELEEVA